MTTPIIEKTPRTTILEINVDQAKTAISRLEKMRSSELDKLVSEYGFLLTRLKETKGALRDAETNAKARLSCSAKAFKTYATAVWKDRKEFVKANLEDQLSLFGGE